MVHLITLPVAVVNETFRWQLDLFWFCHKRVYGASTAASRAHAIVIKRNDPCETKVNTLPWNIDIPHSLVDAFFDQPDIDVSNLPRIGLAVPLNIQIGLRQVLDRFDDDDMLEVTDCDMLHFRPARIPEINENELYVSTVYEDWHLFSLSANRYVIDPYFEHDGRYYNGGFVPLIGRAATFRRILPEWIAVHLDILRRPFAEQNIHWWAGMYALQAACEKARVTMVAKDYCYAPEANVLTNSHYIGHYCVDKTFDKRTYPSIDVSKFDLINPYYHLIKEWLHVQK